MPKPDDRMASLERRLGRSLETLEHEAKKIVAGEEALDPDATLDALDLGTRVLQDLLTELMTVTSEELHQRAAPVDPVRVLREEAERLGKNHKRPLVLDLRLPPDLPAVAAPELALREVVRDLLSLCAAAAGRGGTVTLAARREDDEVGLLVEARGGEDSSDAVPVALEDVVATLSGRLHTERCADGTFRACLVLPSAAAAPRHGE